LKHLGVVLTLVTFAFCGTMNALVLLRQIELHNLDPFKAGVTEFLGNDLQRERWMGVYRRGLKIGYTGYTFEKVLALEGIEIHSVLDSAVEIDLLGQRQWIELQGRLVADERLLPLTLQLDAAFEGRPAASVSGSRGKDGFAVTVRAGPMPPIRLALPLEELHLADALVPSLPVSGFAVGDEIKVPCFDPVLMSRSTAAMKVVGTEVLEVDGMQVEAFRLETAFRGMTATSWVSESGEVLRQKFGAPLEDIELRRESKIRARSVPGRRRPDAAPPGERERTEAAR
jgi:hypothetical protein